MQQNVRRCAAGHCVGLSIVAVRDRNVAMSVRLLQSASAVRDRNATTSVWLLQSAKAVRDRKTDSTPDDAKNKTGLLM